MNMPHKGFCGNDETHEAHEVSTQPDYDTTFVPHNIYWCEGVDEEGRAITEERTPINDCSE